MQAGAVLQALQEAGLQAAKAFAPVEQQEGRGWAGYLPLHRELD